MFKRLFKTILLLGAFTVLAGCGLKKNDSSRNGISFGKVVDQVYYNDYMKIKCDLGTTWKYYGEEEIEEINKDSYELFNVSEEVQEQVKNVAVVCMYASSLVNGTDTLNITYERLNGDNKLITDAKYSEYLIENAQKVLKSGGFANTSFYTEEIEFCGEKYYGVHIMGMYSGRSVFETMYFRRIGDYMTLITACTWEEDATDEIFAKFAKFDEEIPSPKPTETPKKVKPYSVGQTDGTQYSNEFLNIRYDAGNNTITNRAGVLSAAGLDENTSEADFAKYAEDSNSVMLFRSDSTTGIVVTVSTENLNALADTLDEKGYLEIAARNLEASYKQYGITDIGWEIMDIDFAGEKDNCLKFRFNYQDVEYTQCVVARKLGKHIGVISLSANTYDDIVPILNQFTKY